VTSSQGDGLISERDSFGGKRGISTGISTAAPATELAFLLLDLLQKSSPTFTSASSAGEGLHY
jgi:hypothetical protein